AFAALETPIAQQASVLAVERERLMNIRPDLDPVQWVDLQRADKVRPDLAPVADLHQEDPVGFGQVHLVLLFPFGHLALEQARPRSQRPEFPRSFAEVIADWFHVAARQRQQPLDPLPAEPPTPRRQRIRKPFTQLAFAADEFLVAGVVGQQDAGLSLEFTKEPAKVR